MSWRGVIISDGRVTAIDHDAQSGVCVVAFTDYTEHSHRFIFSGVVSFASGDDGFGWIDHIQESLRDDLPLVKFMDDDGKPCMEIHARTITVEADKRRF